METVHRGRRQHSGGRHLGILVVAVSIAVLAAAACSQPSEPKADAEGVRACSRSSSTRAVASKPLETPRPLSRDRTRFLVAEPLPRRAGASCLSAVFDDGVVPGLLGRIRLR